MNYCLFSLTLWHLQNPLLEGSREACGVKGTNDKRECQVQLLQPLQEPTRATLVSDRVNKQMVARTKRTPPFLQQPAQEANPQPL